ACKCWSAADMSQLLQNAAYQHGTIADRVFGMYRNYDSATIGRVA
ncbi:hypothetical protein L195_g057083, partial [Trifolium pratense]